MRSIRYRIIIFLVISLVIINTISGYSIYIHTQKEVEEIFNAQQALIARTINQLISDAGISDIEEGRFFQELGAAEKQSSIALAHQYEKKIAYQVWDLEGNLLLMSDNAPLHPLSATAPGLSRTEYQGEIWNIFALYSNSAKKWIYTAQKSEAREELIQLITQDHLISMLVVSVLIFIIVVGGVMIGTRPINRLSREIAKRNGTHLQAITIPISEELRPIQEGVNRLLMHIDEKIKQEKSFSADLSHELRTPLAAIKIHAQNIELRETLSAAGKRSVESMSRGINNMSKTIEQLLLLNSIEVSQATLMREVIDLYELAKEVLSLMPSEIHRKNDIELRGEHVHVLGNQALLVSMIRNVLENASKYSDNNSKIIIQTLEEGTSIVLEVIDSGPGMSDEQKNNAIKRHFRVADNHTYGSGLGLSIVQRIVDLHNAKLTFLDRENEPGLITRVSFMKVD